MMLIGAELEEVNQLHDLEEISTYRHVRHPFSERLLYFLHRFPRSILDRPEEE